MYRFLDHPSEAFIEVTSGTIEEILEESAVALFETMTDTSKIKPEKNFKVQLESNDRNNLLIDWLNRLILLHEVERVFLSQFEVHVHRNLAWKLKAKVKGEPIHDKQERRSQVKSATYGQLEWIEESKGHRVRFLLDI
jgi:SHS2 domain-containing protein